MAAERNFSAGDWIIRTQEPQMVTVIGEVTAIKRNMLVVKIQFCSDFYGNRIPDEKGVERQIHKNAANLVNLSSIVSTANQKSYLLDR